MLADLLPQGLKDLLGPNVTFWLGYITNGKHLAWYNSVQYTLEAMVFGAIVALILGTIAAAARNNGPWPIRLIAAGYTNIVRGVPDVLFFLFFPLAFEQGVEWIWSFSACTPETIAAQTAPWPPCPAANWTLHHFRLHGARLHLARHRLRRVRRQCRRRRPQGGSARPARSGARLRHDAACKC